MKPGTDGSVIQAMPVSGIDLPEKAQAYLRRIEELAGAPIRFISVGPERNPNYHYVT